jgi:CubicO group peptidase (beta-lactamase class C family)
MRVITTVVTLFLLTITATFVGADAGLRENAQVADAIHMLDRWIEQQLVFQKLPGLSIAVVHDQDVVWAKGYGYARLDSKVPAAPDTVYRLGSITKVFTATAIMQLRDQGKLRLDDPVSQHLPWFRVQNPFSGSPEVTIRQLLTHTSGLPREADFPYWTDHVFPTSEQLAEKLPTQQLINPPETTYHYSNLGMALLGAVVAEVSGHPWAQYLEEEIFEPLHMGSTSALPGPELMQRQAAPYKLMAADGSRETFDYYDTGAMGPAANMVSTVQDLAKFAALQFRDDSAEENGVLRASSLREMHRVHWLDESFSGGRGLGYSVFRSNGKTFVGHGGWIGGNRSYLLLMPEEKIAVIAAINADDRSPFLYNRQAYELVGSAILKATRADNERAQPEADPAWQKYLGVYRDPWGWEYEVVIQGGELAIFSHDYPPDDDASAGYTRLIPVAGNTFRMPDNELVRFELGDDGTVWRIKRRNDYILPVKD